MLYVIPFIVLLVVLILLKLREGSKKGTDKSKKTTSKKAIAKASKRSKSGNSDEDEQKDAPSDDEITQPNSTSTVDEKFKQSIEKLIKARTFYTAEAKINQALNQDSSKHELYLYLVDIHLAQNDEFAIKQLLNYVRSLGLDHIAEQAEEKQRNYVPEEVIEEPVEEVKELVDEASTELNQSNTNHGTKAFDALIIDTSDNSFDELHSDIKAEAEEGNDLKVFEFYTAPPVVSTPAPQEEPPEPVAKIEEEFVEKIESFDFDDLKSLSDTSTESASAEIQTAQEEPLSFSNQSLDFNLSKPAQIEVETPEISLEDDFNFEEKAIVESTPLGSETSIDLDVDIPSLAKETKAEDPHHLDFNLDSPDFNLKADDSQSSTESLTTGPESDEFEFTSVANQAEVETPSAENASPTLEFESTLDFAFDQPNVAATTHETSTAQAVVDTANSDQDLDFSVETPTTTYTVDASQEQTSDLIADVVPEALSIEPSALAFTSSTLSDVASTVAADQDDSALNLAVPVNDSHNFVADQNQHTQTPVEETNDPLALAFPHLNDIDEATLDLQLAERYIALGALDAAKVLLSRNSSLYTSEQREYSENLLNKIAS